MSQRRGSRRDDGVSGSRRTSYSVDAARVSRGLPPRSVSFASNARRATRTGWHADGATRTATRFIVPHRGQGDTLARSRSVGPKLRLCPCVRREDCRSRSRHIRRSRASGSLGRQSKGQGPRPRARRWMWFQHDLRDRISNVMTIVGPSRRKEASSEVSSPSLDSR